MRRSAAPSKRFAPPARTSTAALATRPAPGPTVTAAGHTNGSAGERASGPPAASNKASANRTPLAPVKRPASAAAGSRPPQAAASRKRFAAPQRTRPVQDPRADAGAEGVPEERYFSGVWCKASKKKHKKWEGDCLLVVRGRSVRLKDSEGKDIGTSKNMRAADLKTLRVGETLFIGGKEVEIMGTISSDDWATGKCFLANQAAPSRPAAAAPSRKALPKFRPMSAAAGTAVDRAPVVIKPRFDPLAEGALVMPRPSARRGEEQIVDVVVDPHLSRHLRPHQREGVTFLYECLCNQRDSAGTGAVLADEMGLGKTLQCITLLWTLLKQGSSHGKPVVKRAMIVCPSSLVNNWGREFDKWLGRERLQVFKVDKEHTVGQFASSKVCPVMVISYELFLRNAKAIAKLPLDAIMCDEGHRLKNINSKCASALMQLPCRRRVILTGTPIQNDLQEFYAIMEFVNPGVLGSLNVFRTVYESPILRSREPGAKPADVELGQNRGAELGRVVGLFCLRRTAEVNQKYLPPKVDYVVFCRPTDEQVRLYKLLLSSRVLTRCLTGSRTSVESGGGGSPHLVCVDALKKLCNSVALLEPNVALAAGQPDHESLYSGLVDHRPSGGWPQGQTGNSGKLGVLMQMLHQLREAPEQERCVVVSNSTKCLGEIELLCNEAGFPLQRLEGSTPTAKRVDMVQRFNKGYGDQFLFLLSSKAGGTGLNIVGASRLILFDSDWNPANDLQAMARIWRPGQTRKVFIYRLLTTGTIEEKIYQRQITKQGLSGAVSDVHDKIASGSAKSGAGRGFSRAELRDIFTLREDTSCDTHDLLTCDCGASHANRAAGHLSAKKKLSIDELMKWDHVFPPFSDSAVIDNLLAAVEDGALSCVFYNLTEIASVDEVACPDGMDASLPTGDTERETEADASVAGVQPMVTENDEEDGRHSSGDLLSLGGSPEDLDVTFSDLADVAELQA